MGAIPVTSYGIVLRKKALDQTTLRLKDLLLHHADIFAQNQRLVSLGPYKNRRHQLKIIKKLTKSGLVYGLDYLDVDQAIPDQVEIMLDLQHA